MTKNWKYYLGLSLFVYSCLPVVAVASLPWLGVSLAQAGTLAVVLLTSGEIAFYAAAALLGKQFLALIKQRCAAWLRRPVRPPRPVSRARHRAGVWLFALSFLPYYVVLLYLLFFAPDTATIHFLAWTMVAGEVLGIISLFMLGGQFWERLKGLFVWQQEPVEAPQA